MRPYAFAQQANDYLTVQIPVGAQPANKVMGKVAAPAVRVTFLPIPVSFTMTELRGADWLITGIR